MIKQSKLSTKTREKLKTILKKEKVNSFTNDALDAIKINGEITGQEAIKKYNQWKRS